MKAFRTRHLLALIVSSLCHLVVSTYDIDDSVLHKVTFSPHASVDSKSADKVPDPYSLRGGDSTIFLDKEGNKVPKTLVEEILAAQRELEDQEAKSLEDEATKENKEFVADGGRVPEEEDDVETVTMTTRHNEKYVCTLPKMKERQKLNMDDKYSGQTPLDLLEPLLTQQPCTHRLDHYWTYELCHGKTLRQYHEERDGSKVKKTEYFLGKYSKELFSAERDSLRKSVNEARASGSALKKPRKKRVESMNMPYFELIMTDGTLCDLNNLPRKTRVQYVCYPSGHNEIFALEETSTCEYEVLVLTPLLCKHPDYRAESAQEKEIRCVPLSSKSGPSSGSSSAAGEKPADLLALEKANDEYREKFANAYEGTFTSDGKGTVKISFKQVKAGATSGSSVGTASNVDEDEPDTSPAVNLPKKTTPPSPPKPVRPPFKPLTDPVVVKEFLLGKHCLYGGSGWWKYEFCYGKKVDQYHEENGKRVSVINLGSFDSNKHIEWIKANPSKAPRKNLDMRKQVSHLYSDGDWCELAEKKRTVEVKLKCKKSDSPSAVSLYLLEPKTCEYILGVESPLICDILPQANDYGLMDMALSEEPSKLNDAAAASTSHPDSAPQESEEVLQLRKALGLPDNSIEDEEELALLLEHAKRAAEIAKQAAAAAAAAAESSQGGPHHHHSHQQHHEEHHREHLKQLKKDIGQHKAQHKLNTKQGIELEDLAVDYDTLSEAGEDYSEYSLEDGPFGDDARLVEQMLDGIYEEELSKKVDTSIEETKNNWKQNKDTSGSTNDGQSSPDSKQKIPPQT